MDAQLDHDLNRILDSGAEVAYDENLDYPKWYDTLDPSIKTEYAREVGQAYRFKESGIKRVDPYEYVASAIINGFEVIKW